MSNHQIIAERTKEPLLVSRLGIITGVVAICGTIWATGAERGTLAANILELRGAVLTLTSAVAANTSAINQLKVDQTTTATKLQERTANLEVVVAQNHKVLRQQTQKFNENRADLHRTTLRQEQRQEQLAVQQDRDRTSAATAAELANRNASTAKAVASRAAEEARAAKTAAATSADAAADAAMSAATPPPVIVMAPKPAQRSLKSLILGTK